MPHQARQRNSRAFGVVAPLILLALFTLANIAHAASIDSTNKYAWSTVGGWVNFDPTNGSVAVSSTGLSGYAWSANDGWINLAPASGGVKNDSTGTLSGFAWDEVAGWVDFSGVTIDSTGTFHGEAIGATVNGVQNVINFDCTHCDVQTTWRPSSTSSAGSSGTSGQSVAKTVTQTTPAAEPPAGSVPPTQSPSGAGTMPATGAPASSGSGGVAPSSSLLPSWLTGSKTASSSASHATTSTTTPHHSLFPLTPNTLRTLEIIGAAIALVAVLVLVWIFFF